MSDKPDQESKTETATEKRREEALDQGNTPMSRELGNLGFVLAMLIAGTWMGLGASGGIAGALSAFLERPAEIQLSSAADVAALLRALTIALLPWLAPLPLILIAVGIAFQVVQTPLRVSWKRIEPKASRLSMSAGWQRMTGIVGWTELAKGLAKIAFFGVLAILYLTAPHATLVRSLDTPIETLPSLLTAASVAILIPIGIAVAVLAAVDVAVSRVTWERRLRMTRQEVRDEAKQNEGDQALAARRRAIARARVRRMMVLNVPRATLVVANPTHYAVALRYVRSEGGSPVVVAKGKDHLALQIRRIAEAGSIPVVEDKALARSLYAAVEVDQSIPQEFYAAVAGVLLMLRRLGNRHVLRALDA
ncbi:MAG: EscU/YscU/HrcU family type III secretion system export apparatus switch protein [Hyphomicrobium sp.]|nr:EscU/YscU/HrcU family type III secretion system export apparatus switch protein [Hyphomicrobium sp.]